MASFLPSTCTVYFSDLIPLNYLSSWQLIVGNGFEEWQWTWGWSLITRILDVHGTRTSCLGDRTCLIGNYKNIRKVNWMHVSYSKRAMSELTKMKLNGMRFRAGTFTQSAITLTHWITWGLWEIPGWDDAPSSVNKRQSCVLLTSRCEVHAHILNLKNSFIFVWVLWTVNLQPITGVENFRLQLVIYRSL